MIPAFVPGAAARAAAQGATLVSPGARSAVRRRPRLLSLLVLLATALAGCGATPWRPAGLPERVELTDVPFHAQQQYECGPASLAMLLNAAGVEVAPETLVPQVYLPARQGSFQLELVAATRRHGRIPYVLDPAPAALYRELAAGRPVLVLQNFGSRSAPQWHYATAVGYEPGRVLLRSGTTERERLREARFIGTWSRADAWALVALRPGELPAGADARRYLAAAAAFETAAPPDAAAAAYEAATRRWPTEPAAWFGLGNARTTLGDVEGAEAAFRAVLDARPAHAAARNNLAELLARRGCLDAARVEMDRAARDALGTPLEAAVLATQAELAGRAELPGASPTCPAP